MKLADFAASVNKLARKHVDRLNNEHKAGKRLFGASHVEFPATMLDHYRRRGLTPKQALAEIHADGRRG